MAGNIIDPFQTPVALPMSKTSLRAFQSLSREFIEPLTPKDLCTVLNAFLLLDFASKGTKTPRELQLRAALAFSHGKDLVVRAGTGSGKTLAMILPALSLSSDKIIITISPLRLIQDNHVRRFYSAGSAPLILTSRLASSHITDFLRLLSTSLLRITLHFGRYICTDIPGNPCLNLSSPKQIITSHSYYRHYSVSPEQCGP